MPIQVSKAAASTVSFGTPQEIVISHVDDSIKIGDGTDTVGVSTVGAVKALKVDVVQGGSSGTPGQATMAASSPVVIASNQTAIPVSGTFWQTTQPISGTVSANATLAAETTKVIGTINVASSQSIAATQSGTWTVQPGNTANTTAWKVDGSAVTQPVSGPLTDTQLRATAVPISATNLDVALSTRLKPADTLTAVTTVTSLTQMNGAAIAMGTGTRSAGTQRVTIATDDVVPVTGTFFQSTQPVSIATAPVLVAGSAIIGKVGIDQTTPGTTNLVALTAETTKVIGTVNVAAAQTITAAQATAANLNATVVGPTLTKGTQGSAGFSVQDLKDSGRTNVNFYAVAAAAGTTGTETLLTLTKASGNSATSTGTSFVITSGKRFRITSLSFATRANATATTHTTTFNLRINTAGATLVNSTPILLSARSAAAAVASAWDRVMVTIPDGFEILGDGTLTFGISANATYVTNAPTWDVTMTGFEY